MHNHNDRYLARQGFEPGTSRLQAPVDTNEPLGPAQYQETNTMLKPFRLGIRAHLLSIENYEIGSNNSKKIVDLRKQFIL